MSRGAGVQVLVCGERLRRDDGAALAAIGLLPNDAIALANLVEVGQLSVDTLLALPPEAALILVDSAVGIAAGTVIVRSLSALTHHPDTALALASSHAMPAQDTLGLAVELRGGPFRGAFVGLGGAAFDFGEGLSPAVAAALPEFAAAIESEIRRFAAG